MGKESLFQSSALRLSGIGFGSPSVVTGSDFRFMVVEQLAAVEIAPKDIIIEPSARNTAAAVCAAAVTLETKNGESLMLVAPYMSQTVPSSSSKVRAAPGIAPNWCQDRCAQKQISGGLQIAST